MPRKIRVHKKKDKEEKKRKKTMLIWSLFIAFLFVGSTIASVVLSPWGQNQDEINILNHTFIRASQGWNLKYNDNEVRFNFLPSQLKTFNLSKEAFSQLKTSPMFLFATTSNSELVSLVSYGKLQLSKEWGQIKPTYILYGFLEPLTNYSQVTCENSSLAPVLVFEEGNISKVSKLEDRCYQVQIDTNFRQDLFQFFDLMGYIRLGVIDEETFFNRGDNNATQV